MKVLVTGGAGFIGSHIVDAYLAAGHNVIVVDDLSTGKMANLNPAAKLYRMDIRDPELAKVFERERPDFVNHHAAQAAVRRSIEEPLFDAEVNILGSINLIENARRMGVKRFIYISSGGAIYGEPQTLPCDETHPIVPICPYGATKHTVEHYLHMVQVNFGLEYTVLRYANVYGPRQDPNGEAGVVAIFAGRMLNDQQAIINGDGENTRDFVYVGDIARANLLALTVAHPCGAYNIGCGIPTSINQIFSMLKRITGSPMPEVHGPAKLGETRQIYLNTEKAHRELGWQPEVVLEEGLRQTVEYFRRPVAPR
jgi:UDP-glucose 4-epimerase